MALTQVGSGGIKDDAITDAKLPANSVGNSEMKDDAVGVAELSATGTASNTTFLRGDNSWQTVSTTTEGEAVLSTTNSNEANTKFLRADGDGTCSWQTPTDTNTTYSVGDGGLTENNFTDADHTKLDGIAAGATVGPTLTGSTDNTICTVTGANAIAGEANLTFEGGATGDALLSIHAQENATTAEAILKLETSNDFAESVIQAYDSSGIGGSLKYNHGDNAWRISTNADTERLRIDSSGHVGVDATSPKATVHLKSHTNDWEGGILIEDSAGGDGWNIHPETDSSLIIGFNDDTSQALADQSATAAVRIYSTGNVKINDGNLWVASGHGIDFSATSDGSGASSVSELLDDYEEGTFPAKLGGSSNLSSYWIDANTAYYTKVGRVVHLFIAFEGKNLDDNASGHVKISGMPFSAASGGGWTTDFTSFNVGFDTSERQQFYISGANMYGLESANNSSWSDWSVGDFDSSTMYLRINMTYHV